MNIYVILANTLSGVSGGPIYVRNKMRFLKEKGWCVLVIDSTDVFDDPIIIDELKPYHNNRFYELLFPPSWFTKRKREKILNRLLDLIKQVGDNRYVVESTQITLALWGEMLAEKLGGKHIIFNINENDRINDDKLYGFLNTKYYQNELFCISPSAVRYLFSKYGGKLDAEEHYWNAIVQNNVEDISLPILNEIKESDFCIGYFGRYKRFVPYIIEQVKDFCRIHNATSVVLVFLGISKDELNINEVPANLRLLYLGPMSPIPRAFFNTSDVVIATAGCASISYRYSSLVISMSVEEDARVIGFLGKTTFSSSFPDTSDTIIKPLVDYLELSYSGEAYSISQNGYNPNQVAAKGYDYQLDCISSNSDPIDVTGLYCVQNNTQKIMKFIVGIGCAKVAYLLKKMRFRNVRKRK